MNPGRNTPLRRDVLRLLGLAPLAFSSAGAARFDGPIGAQLYTVRNEIQERPAEVLRAIADIGYTEVEVQDGHYPKLASILNDLGLEVRGYRLTPAIATGNFALWRDMADRIPKGMGLITEELSIEEGIQPAAEAKTRYVVCSQLMPPERDTVDKLKKAAERFNYCGEVCKKANLTFCFHNHNWEFDPVEGTTAFEVLNEELDPKLVEWQIDVYWAAVGGRDPVRLISELGGRVASLHLKDGDVSKARQLSERPSRDQRGGIFSPDMFQPLGKGTGAVDLPAILKAAAKAGVQHSFVELDVCPNGPINDLRTSYEYLRSLDL